MRIALVTTVCALACTEPNPPPPPPVAALSVVFGDAQAGEVGTALAQPVSVLATDAAGNRVRGATVRFRASPSTSGSHPAGSVNPVSAVTDREGVAQVRWTLGSVVGAQSLSAESGSAGSEVSATATARALPGAAASLRADLEDGVVRITAGDTGWVTISGLDRYDNETELTRSVPPLASHTADPTVAEILWAEEVSLPWRVYNPHPRAVVLGRRAGTTTLEVEKAEVAGTPMQLRVDVRVYAGPGRDIAVTGEQGIYLLSADGTQLMHLAEGYGPAWSPDGREIAFTGPGSEIRVMNADGSGLRTVMMDGFRPAWSPDGQQIAFVRVGPPGGPFTTARAYVMNRDGSGVQPLSPADCPPATLCDLPDRLSWAPDGALIAYGAISGGPRIALANADGSGVRALTLPSGGALFGREPQWAVDGRSLLFVSTLQAGLPAGSPTTSGDLYIISRDGTGLRRVTRAWNIAAEDGLPAWSPDGRIAFSRRGFGCGIRDVLCRTNDRTGLFVVNADGTELRRVTARGIGDPAWRPTPP
jgi:Tol biopolymer transport system component